MSLEDKVYAATLIMEDLKEAIETLNQTMLLLNPTVSELADKEMANARIAIEATEPVEEIEAKPVEVKSAKDDFEMNDLVRVAIEYAEKHSQNDLVRELNSVDPAAEKLSDLSEEDQYKLFQRLVL